MDGISSAPSLSLRQDHLDNVQSSLPDNWKHLQIVPRVIVENTELSTSSVTSFNINEDDCPDQCAGTPLDQDASLESFSDYNHFSCSSSSEDLHDSCDDEAGSRSRIISIDDGKSDGGDDNNDIQFSSTEQFEDCEGSRTRSMSIDDVKSEDEDVGSNVVCFMLPNSEYDSESESELEISTPTTQKHLRAPEESFFKLKRRASFDNGVFGMPDRILRGEIGCDGLERNAITAPGTPADPSTPVPRCLSQEDLLHQPEQVFNRIYNLLCAERVTQMTKTYSDIEAVTHLLEEKERDLELAARIGQTLLGKNKELTSRGDTLEEQLSLANEKINQLKHDVSMKDELLRFYCQDLQDQSPGDGSPGTGPTNLSKINIDMLQTKVGVLEEENLTLRLESAQLRSDTETYEEKEKKLVEDCLQQLVEVNQQVETFAGELRLKTEENARQKEEMTALLSQVADLHKRVRQLTIENMDLAEKLQASQESQRQLTKQLNSQQDRYDELFEMLEEAQDELRGHRNRNNPKATRHLYASAALPHPSAALDSLASELQSSMQQEEDEQSERRAQSWKVFETARAARKAASKSSHGGSVRMSISASGSQATSNINSDSDSFNSDGYSADMDSMYGSSTELGRPGIPGSNDLESALRRLALRRANEMNERDFMESHLETRSEELSPYRVAGTPDSTTSPASCYSYLGYSNNNQPSTQFKMSDKLQIVKPLEGSATLRQWQRLAQPHLGGLFERREGVKVKGERKLDLEGEVYTLSDFEEDEDIVQCPSRRVADSSTVYTFTNSMVSHPSEQSLQLSESCSSLQPVESSTPHSQSSLNKSSSASSTYTMSLGLAAILQERGGSSSTTGCVLRPIASCPVMPPNSSTMPGTTQTTTCAGGGGESGDAVSNPSLFGKLISTGYSLLWNKSDGPVSSASSVVSSTPSSLSSSLETLTGGIASAQKSKASEVLKGGSSAGVLEAMATFRKNGFL